MRACGCGPLPRTLRAGRNAERPSPESSPLAVSGERAEAPRSRPERPALTKRAGGPARACGPPGPDAPLEPRLTGCCAGVRSTAGVGCGPVQVSSPQDRHPSGHSCVNTALHPQKQALRHRRRARKAAAHLRPGALRRCARPCPALVAFASGRRRDPVGVHTRWRGGSGWLARGERIEPWPINEPNCLRSGMPQPRDPARAASAPRQTKKTPDPAHRPRPPQGPVTAREWDVAHAAALGGLLTQPPAVLPNQVGDPLLPLQIGIRDALLPLLRPGAEPEALARALRAYTRSTGYFMACARKDAMRHDLEGRAVEPVSEEHRTGAVKAVQGRRRRPAVQRGASDAGAQVAPSE